MKLSLLLIMKIVKFSADLFRNLKNIEIYPNEGMNIIFGQNAQGKTNLIEAIWLFSGAKSFRNNKESKMICFGSKRAELSIEFDDRKRIQKGNIVLGEKNKFFLNRVELTSQSDFNGNFHCIVFSPSHLSVIQGAPSARRKFVDQAISQIRPDYNNYLNQYKKVLYQRNALLKSMGKSSYLLDTLSVWDSQLAKLGTIISILRTDYIEKITRFSYNIYLKLSSKSEKMEVLYNSTVFDDIIDREYTEEKVEIYKKKLEENIEQDISQKFTSAGVHRDEIEILVNKKSLRNYGSQGQQRSGILALKLAEAQMLKNVTGNYPVILLDDVMSELDISRQDYILNHVKGHQVFITCCDISNALRLQSGKIFQIEDGTAK